MKPFFFHTGVSRAGIAGAALIALVAVARPALATSATPAPKPPVTEEVIVAPVVAPALANAVATAAVTTPAAQTLKRDLPPGMEKMPQVDCMKEQGKLPFYISELLKGPEAWRRNEAFMCLARAMAAISGQTVEDVAIPVPAKVAKPADEKTEDKKTDSKKIGKKDKK